MRLYKKSYAAMQRQAMAILLKSASSLVRA